MQKGLWRFLGAFSLVGIAFLGIYLWGKHVVIDFLPELKPTTVEVQIESLGLSTDEVENLVTLNLEELLVPVPWLEELSSRSIRGLSDIVLRFREGTPLMDARQMVTEVLALAHAIPNVAKPPVILQPRSSANRVMVVGIASDTLSLIDISELARWKFRPFLLSVKGVSNISIWGYRDRQWQVRVDPKVLQKKGISLKEVISAAGNTFWISPLTYLEASEPGASGWIETPNQRLGVHHLFPLENVEDFSKVSLEEKPLTLGEVGEVKEDHQPLIGDGVLARSPGILLVIEKFPGADTRAIIEQIKEKLATFKLGLKDISFDTEMFALGDFLNAVLQEWIITFLLSLVILALGLWVWYQSVYLSLWFLFEALVVVAVWSFAFYLLGIPVTLFHVIGLFVALFLWGSYFLFSQKYPFRTTGIFLVLAFLPSIPFLAQMDYSWKQVFLAFLQGYLLGGIAFLFPLWGRRWWGRLFAQEQEKILSDHTCLQYPFILQRFLSLPFIALLIVAGVSSALALLQKPIVAPSFKESNAILSIKLPEGASYFKAKSLTEVLHQQLAQIPEVKHYATQIGRAVLSDEVADVYQIRTHLTLKKPFTKEALQKLFSKFFQKDTWQPFTFDWDVDTFYAQVLHRYLEPKEPKALVRLFGMNFEGLAKNAEVLKHALEKIPGVSAQIKEFPKESQLHIRLDLEKAKKWGIKPGDVRREVSIYVNGLVVGNYYRDQKIYEAVVWGVPSVRDEVEDISNMLIEGTRGRVRLKDIAEIQEKSSFSTIYRKHMSRFQDIVLHIEDTINPLEALQKVEKVLKETPLDFGYHAVLKERYTQEKALWQEISELLLVVWILTLFLLQALLKSWRGAFWVLLGALIGLLGVSGALYYFSHFWWISAFFALVGIFVFSLLQGYEAIQGKPFLGSTFFALLFLFPGMLRFAFPGHEILFQTSVLLVHGIFLATIYHILIFKTLSLRLISYGTSS